MVRQSILSLADRHKIDYVGPEIIENIVKVKINSVVELDYDHGFSGMAGMLFRGAMTGYYRSWQSKVVGIDWSLYDLVHLEYSRQGFIARQVSRNSKKMIVRVHNVENDYYSIQNLDRRSFLNRLRNRIKRSLIARQEKACLVNADCVICLTIADRERLKELYPLSLSNCRLAVIPVSIEKPGDFSNLPDVVIEKNQDKPYLLITGSLWFGPNAQGAVWFINNVWRVLQENKRELREKYRLVIAGSKPGKEIRSQVSRYDDIELIDTPPDIRPYFENASLYIAPIYSGAGMKVKVAEALSYGLPVIGTSHALSGYGITDRENVYRANDTLEFINALQHYTDLSVEEKRAMKMRVYNYFCDYHSIEASARHFQSVINGTNRFKS